MLNSEKVLAVLRMKGPSLPVQIKKALGEGDTFMIGALLTELRENGRIKISNVRRGGSPFYYAPEHTTRLAEFVSDLGEKERRTAELLKREKILRDRAQDPLVRVALRQIKDFAIPVEVKRQGDVEVFWKWFTTSHDEATLLIKQLLGVQVSSPEEPVKTAPTKAVETVEPSAPAVVQKSTEPLPIVEKIVREETVPEKKDVKKEASVQHTLAVPVPASKIDPEGDEFLEQVLNYFAEKHIQVVHKEVLRKNSDIEFCISLPTPVGRVEYFCKAKSKKKNNDGDLSGAYVTGQVKKLPVIYLTTGEVTKKALEKLKTDFKGMVLVEL